MGVRIYIAAPYQAENIDLIQANIDKVLTIAVRLTKGGYSVFVPHLTHYIDLKAKEMGIEIDNNTWVELDLAWLVQSDVMLVLGLSPGVEREIEFALEHKILVIWDLNKLLGTLI